MTHELGYGILINRCASLKWYEAVSLCNILCHIVDLSKHISCNRSRACVNFACVSFFFSCCFYKDNGWVLFIIFKDYKKETPLRWCGNISTVPRHRICDRYAYAMALFVKRIWLKFNLLWFLSVGLSHDGIDFVPAFCHRLLCKAVTIGRCLTRGQ